MEPLSCPETGSGLLSAHVGGDSVGEHNKHLDRAPVEHGVLSNNHFTSCDSYVSRHFCKTKKLWFSCMEVELGVVQNMMQGK